jgi:hypothetical protein
MVNLVAGSILVLLLSLLLLMMRFGIYREDD